MKIEISRGALLRLARIVAPVLLWLILAVLAGVVDHLAGEAGTFWRGFGWGLLILGVVGLVMGLISVMVWAWWEETP